MAAGTGTLAAIFELYGFNLGRDIEGYETVESDLYLDLTSSVVSAIFAVSGDSERKGKAKEDSDDGSDDGSRFLWATIREGWQEMAVLFGEITDVEEGRLVGFLLLVVSNVCRIEPTQVVRLCCGLGDECIAIGMIVLR